MLNPNLDEIQLLPEEYARYSRHLILPEVGLEGQNASKLPVSYVSGRGDSVRHYYFILLLLALVGWGL